MENLNPKPGLQSLKVFTGLAPEESLWVVETPLNESAVGIFRGFNVVDLGFRGRRNPKP